MILGSSEEESRRLSESLKLITSQAGDMSGIQNSTDVTNGLDNKNIVSASS